MFCFCSDANARRHQSTDGFSTAFSRQSAVRADGQPPRSRLTPLFRLYLKRAMPERCVNKIEHFLTSANVLIRLQHAETDPNFTEQNIRSYFQSYGTIIRLHLFANNRCVIEFIDYG